MELYSDAASKLKDGSQDYYCEMWIPAEKK